MPSAAARFERCQPLLVVGEALVAGLRTLAVLYQRGAEISWEELLWPAAEHNQYAITIRVDQPLFWRTFNELHPHSGQTR
ncbi:MAG: hypothetical protein V3R95_05760 [Dehalococcoidia bacterium]